MINNSFFWEILDIYSIVLMPSHGFWTVYQKLLNNNDYDDDGDDDDDDDGGYDDDNIEDNHNG